MRSRRVAGWFLGLVALRLLAWALLLPPWSGFDEPFHHSLVLDQAERLRWPGFRQTFLRPELVAETRRWPIAGPYRFLSTGESNYETQQSPLYYWATGIVLRPIRGASPIVTLYVLRLANAALAMLAAVLTASVARRLFEDRGWVPLAYLGLLPGMGVALTRVSNDALAAVAISLSMAGALGFSSWWTLAAGVAPWAKLYGGAIVPGSLLPVPGERRLRWASRVLAIGACVLLLLALSVRIHGHMFPIQEDVHPRPDVALANVSWARNVWTIAKSHVFFSGMPIRVFPKWLYGIALALLGAATFATLRRARGSDARTLALLSSSLLLFLAALLYHSWRTSSFFGQGGATGGWYLWSMLLPESLFVTWAIARREARPPLLAAALLFFLGLTLLGDLILVLADGGGLAVSRDAVVGVRWPLLGTAVAAYLRSRPLPVAIAGLAVAGASWIVAGLAIRQALRRRLGRVAAQTMATR